MPLVVPGIQSSLTGSNKQQAEWFNKLMGKKLSDSTTNETSFAKKDLPSTHRVVKPGDMTTMDYQPDRMNIHVDDDGTVRDIKFG